MIVKLDSPLKNYIWGGQKLKKFYGKKSDENIAESWELSFVPGSESMVEGKPVSEVTTRADWGKNCDKFQNFPALVKFIDAAQNLSVQVHPSDDYALEHENQFGKTEMWHILAAEPNAKIYLGLSKTVSKEQFVAAIADKTIMSLLNAVPVSAGDTYFVPSGTFHAIGAGVTLIEIQQNSTLTYRVYDYDRVGADGKPRELHLEKAMAVANFEKYVVPDPTRVDLLGKCKYFSAYRFGGSRSFKKSDTFCALSVVEGKISLNDLSLQKGDTAFISAGEHAEVRGDGEYVITCVE